MYAQLRGKHDDRCRRPFEWQDYELLQTIEYHKELGTQNDDRCIAISTSQGLMPSTWVLNHVEKENTIRVYFRHCECLSISLQRKEGELLGAKKPRHTTHQIKAFSRSKYTWISFQASVGNVNIHERHRWYLVRNRHSPVINPTVLSEILRPQFWSLKTIWPI